jgi:hypothetical protein
MTALMLAVVRRQADVVQRLSDAGANISQRAKGAPGLDGKQHWILRFL